MKFFLFKNDILTKFLYFNLKLIKLNAYIFDLEKKETNILKKPPSRLYVQYKNESRLHIKKYFLKFYNNDKKNNLFLDYLSKNYELGTIDRKENNSFFDIFSYLKYNKIEYNKKNFFLISSYKNILCNVYFRNNLKNIFKLLGIIFQIFYFFIFYIRIALIILFSFNLKKILKPSVLFLRKKDYPDQTFNRLNAMYNNSDTFNSILLNFKLSDKNGFLPLNKYKSSFFLSFYAFYKTLIDLKFFLKYFLLFKLPNNFIKRTLIESFITHYLSKIAPKIFFGILVDKPIFILLHRNKLKNSKTISLNESFFYPPFENFDYVNCDVYLPMNKIDLESINKLGGRVNDFKYIPFFRKKIISQFSKGISPELNQIINKFKKVIIIAPIQVERIKYYRWDLEDLESFIKSCINLANKNPEYLFIFKEKKGELKLIQRDILQVINKLKNAYLIRSTKPRYLKYNQFEDLIHISDLLISMSHTSTTIWQFISWDKLPIAVNNNFEPSFLHDFNIETNLENLEKKFDSLISLKKNNREKEINKIKNFVNIHNDDGLKDVKIYLDNHI